MCLYFYMISSLTPVLEPLKMERAECKPLSGDSLPFTDNTLSD